MKIGIEHIDFIGIDIRNTFEDINGTQRGFRFDCLPAFEQRGHDGFF